MPQSFDFAYLGHRAGQDALALRIVDPSVGPVALVMTATGARCVAEHLAGMVEQVDQLRGEWDARTGDEGNTYV